MRDISIPILNTLIEAYTKDREPKVADDWQEAMKLPFLDDKILVIWDKTQFSLRWVKYAISKMEKEWPKIQKNIGVFYDTASKPIKKKLDDDVLTAEKDDFVKRMIPHHILFTKTGASLVLGDFVIRQILNCDLTINFTDFGDPILNRISVIGSC